MFNYLVLEDGSVSSSITLVGHEKYIFLICSQEKHLHFKEESQEKPGKKLCSMCMNPVL